MATADFTSAGVLERACLCENPLDAAHLCQEVIAVDPTHLAAIELCAKSFWRAGHFQDALDQIEAAITLNPYEPGYWFLKGDCLQNLARYGEAVKAFERSEDSAGEAAKKEAVARIRALEEWQESLVAELLRDDPNFRAAYALDPEEALANYGFVFADCVPDRKVVGRRAWPELWASGRLP